MEALGRLTFAMVHRETGSDVTAMGPSRNRHETLTSRGRDDLGGLSRGRKASPFAELPLFRQSANIRLPASVPLLAKFWTKRRC
jgi:hypothetical protein